jgi:hypothetical protein
MVYDFALQGVEFRRETRVFQSITALGQAEGPPEGRPAPVRKDWRVDSALPEPVRTMGREENHSTQVMSHFGQ